MDQGDDTMEYVIYDGSKDPKYANAITINNTDYSFLCANCDNLHTHDTYKIIGVYDFGQTIFIVRSEDVVFMHKIYKHHSRYYADKVIGIIIYDTNAYIWRIYENKLSVVIFNVVNYRVTIRTHKDNYINNDDNNESALMLFMKYYADNQTDLTKMTFGIDLVYRYKSCGIRLSGHYADIRVRCLE